MRGLEIYWKVYPLVKLHTVSAKLKYIENTKGRKKIIIIDYEFTVYAAQRVFESPHLHASLQVVCIWVLQHELSE